MIEYPSIINSSKAPRDNCIAFDKLDGSNIRVKWTQKKGFCLFGSRHELFDESHKFLGEAIPVFNRDFAANLDRIFRREYPNTRDIIAFGEFFGPNSFAGLHVPEDPKQFVLFDVMLINKGSNAFVSPRDFVSTFAADVKTPNVIYTGNLTDQFIKDVRENKFGLNEGVICKGTAKSGAFRGKVWMAKIKTQQYLDKLKAKGLDVAKFGE